MEVTCLAVYTTIHTILNIGQQGPGVHLRRPQPYCVSSKFKMDGFICGRYNQTQQHNVNEHSSSAK